MGILKEDLFGSSSLGVYLSLNNKFLLYPRQTPVEKLQSFKKVFDKDFLMYPSLINQSALLGSYIVMNSKGMIVPRLILDSEYKALEKITNKHGMKITQLDHKDNAFGNLILANDNGAVISSELTRLVKKIQDVLDVEVLISDFAGTRFVGSAGICNNQGCCVHPMVTEEEAEQISSVLKVPVDVSTINMGDPFLRSGAIVNDQTGIFGKNSSGPEMMRLTNMLKL